MKRYFVEYSDDDGETVRTHIEGRTAACALARRMSKKLQSMAYVLDEDREGVIAFANGYLDHKDGVAI